MDSLLNYTQCHFQITAQDSEGPGILATECDLIAKNLFLMWRYTVSLWTIWWRGLLKAARLKPLMKEFGVFTVVCTESEVISVTFDGWGKECNRMIDNPQEIREQCVIPESSGWRKATNLSKKVRSNSELRITFIYSSLLDLLINPEAIQLAERLLKAVSQVKANKSSARVWSEVYLSSV